MSFDASVIINESDTDCDYTAIHSMSFDDIEQNYQN